ncbi:MAG: DUF6285 domain-containing protein [Myxococcota bacterium]|nr:DUF6285 domain-containing protein [Myxococcota bacterium]
MGDTPDKTELLRAVRQFVDRDLLPELSGVRRFHARVASNVLGIVIRELEQGEAALGGRHARLGALLDTPAPAPSDPLELANSIEALERELCERIRAGDADQGPWRERVMQHLSASVRERLALSNPNYR